jgi:hypothetical protein
MILKDMKAGSEIHTKGRVSFDIVRTIQEFHGLSEEVNGLLHGALGAPIEVLLGRILSEDSKLLHRGLTHLAGPLSDPNFPVASSRVVVADILLKTRRSNVVVMQVNSIHLIVS